MCFHGCAEVGDILARFMNTLSVCTSVMHCRSSCLVVSEVALIAFSHSPFGGEFGYWHEL